MIKIGLICGCFDLFHIGHLNILEKCKQNCDYLIVGVCDDEYVKKYKGGAVINETDRKRILKALKCVDEVQIVNEEIIKNRLPFIEKIIYLLYLMVLIGKILINIKCLKKTVLKYVSSHIHREYQQHS